MIVQEFLDSFFSEKTNTIIEIYPSGNKNNIQKSGVIDTVILDIKSWYWHESKQLCLEVLRSSLEYHRNSIMKLIDIKYTLEDILNSKIEYIDVVGNTRDTLGIAISDIKIDI